MKKIKLFYIGLVLALFFTGCSEHEESENVLEDNSTMDLRQNEEVAVIGYVERGIFRFTVSQEKLAEVYMRNIEANLFETGSLEKAKVILSDIEGEEYFLMLAGNYGEEGSAVITTELLTETNRDGVVVVKIRLRPVLPGICYASACSFCRTQDLTLTNRSCRCLVGAFSGECPYIEDPHVVWIE